MGDQDPSQITTDRFLRHGARPTVFGPGLVLVSGGRHPVRTPILGGSWIVKAMEMTPGNVPALWKMGAGRNGPAHPSEGGDWQVPSGRMRNIQRIPARQGRHDRIADADMPVRIPGRGDHEGEHHRRAVLDGREFDL